MWGRDMKNFLVLAIATLALAACTTNPIPQGYTGPVARISDSAEPRDLMSANIFSLQAVNGKDIDDSTIETQLASSGGGGFITTVAIGRDVPARPAAFTITGQTTWVGLIQTIVKTAIYNVHPVSGTINFAPVAGHYYMVKGVLSPDYSAVWIEDVDSHEVMDRKFEVRGSATVGILEK